MASDIKRLDMVKTILQRSILNICKHLDPRPLLLPMVAVNALDKDDATRIEKAGDTNSDKAQKFVDILNTKPASSYDVFMNTLFSKNIDIYNAVAAIEMEVGYTRSEPAAGASGGGSYEVDPSPAPTPQPDVNLDDVLKPSHIKAFLQELTPQQLNKVYEELDIPFTEVQKAIARANTTDPDDKAKEVLRDWQMEKGKNATPRALLQALKECKYNLARQNLEEKWGIRLH